MLIFVDIHYKLFVTELFSFNSRRTTALPVVTSFFFFCCLKVVGIGRLGTFLPPAVLDCDMEFEGKKK